MIRTNMQIDPKLMDIDDCLYRIAVKAIIINDGKILLTYETGDEWWSLPGGGIDYGESIESALRRELHEELGVPEDDIQTDFKVAHIDIGAVVNKIPRMNLYFRVNVPIDKIKSSTEHVIEVKWYKPEELDNLYLSPSTGNAVIELVKKL